MRREGTIHEALLGLQLPGQLLNLVSFLPVHNNERKFTQCVCVASTVACTAAPTQGPGDTGGRGSRADRSFGGTANPSQPHSQRHRQLSVSASCSVWPVLDRRPTAEVELNAHTPPTHSMRASASLFAAVRQAVKAKGPRPHTIKDVAVIAAPRSDEDALRTDGGLAASEATLQHAVTGENERRGGAVENFPERNGAGVVTSSLAWPPPEQFLRHHPEMAVRVRDLPV